MLGRVALNRKLPPPEVLSGWESAQWIYESVDGELRQEAAAAVAELPVDWALVPVEGRRKKLLIADMDSTIINVECLDELADFAGIKAEIAAITERAMRGELEFEPALRERVGKLKGLALDALQKTYDERVRLNPGAATFVKTMAAARRALRARVRRVHLLHIARCGSCRLSREPRQCPSQRWRNTNGCRAGADPGAQSQA